MRLLLAEDDRALGRALADGLRHLGHAVDWVEDGVHALHALDTAPYAAAILDWNLPRMTGVEVVRALRRRGDATPVLLLTARDALGDRVTGLDCGADDYVVKPVHLDELAARVRALLRRSGGDAAPVQRVGALELDPAARSARLSGTPLELSPREYALLESLAMHPGRALSRTQLEETVYGWGEEVASNAIEVHVHHLRRKLGPGWVRTLRGVGYALFPPEAARESAADDEAIPP